jgi:hypothetical protein
MNKESKVMAKRKKSRNKCSQGGAGAASEGVVCDFPPRDKRTADCYVTG